MASLVLFSTILVSHFLFAGNAVDPFIDPTGTYILRGSVKKNHVIGHSGEIRVRLLDSSRVAVCFYINNGYPGYQSAFFMDTLAYENNMVHYTPHNDTTCTILLAFEKRKVEIMKIITDPRCNCGFTEGVLIAADFEKTSDERPVIESFAGRG